MERFTQSHDLSRVNERDNSRLNDFNSYLSKVFLIMFAGLLLSAVVGVFGSRNETVIRFVIRALSSTSGVLIFMLLYFGISALLVHQVRTLNPTMATILFGVFAFLTGLTWSVLGLAFTVDSIWKAFLGAGLFFGIMAVYGYTTKRNLAKFGTILTVALISIIIISVVNLFLKSTMMDMMISIVGIGIFSLYTAYDIQKLKVGFYYNNDATYRSSLAIYGAFTLYLDFINIFIYLLRLFGRSSD